MSGPVYIANPRSMIISSLSRESETVTVVYYCWDCRVQEQKSITFIGTLVTQLISAGHAVPKRLETLHNESSLRASRLESRHFRPLADIFFELAASSPLKPLFIVLDALNEVPNAQWKDVAEFLRQCLTQSAIKIVATTRTTEQLEDIFPADKSDHLGVEASEYEIKTYIGKELKDVELDPQRKADLADRICADSRGL